jgi:membrane fusion protein, multidrug efflux system
LKRVRFAGTNREGSVTRGIGNRRRLAAAGLIAIGLAAGPALAQQPPAKPPAVGVVTAVRKPVTQSSEYVGRIQAVERVNLVARVAAYLDERLFTEGAEVKKGDLLYKLEQGLFQDDVHAKQAVVTQLKAQHANAAAQLYRAKTLLSTPAGLPSNFDAATASEAALQAQIVGAEAQLEEAQINLGYTEIRAPIDGKIGRTSVTVGNYVTPSSGVLATIVSQDPMYVIFAVSSRTAIALGRHAADATDGGGSVIKIRLPDGRMYGQTGTLDFIDNSVAGNTDTITLRGRVGNPRLAESKAGAVARDLVDGEFVTVVLEDVLPVEAVTVPRTAVLADQSGEYVYVVDGDNKAQQRRIQFRPASPSDIAVTSGLAEGERVIVEGIQRVRPGQPVSPGPATAEPAAAASQRG